MKTTFYLIVSLLISFSSNVSAQDFRQAIKDLNNKYRNTENLRIVMSIDVFDAKDNHRSFYKDKVTISKRGNSYHHRLSTTDMVMNDKYIVVVDRPSKRVIINTRDAKGELKFNKQVPFNLDSMLQFYPDAKLESTADEINKYSATLSAGAIQRIEMFIQKGSGDLKQINYAYKTGQWVTIVFNEFDLSPTFDAREFDEQQFVRKSGRSWQTAPTLNGYQVINANDSKMFAAN